MLIIAGILAVLTVFDIVLHVAIDDVEPLRIAGNIIVLTTALGILVIPRLRRAWIAFAAGAWNLVLNLIFINQEGIGTLGAALVAATTVLCVVLMVMFARARRPRD